MRVCPHVGAMITWQSLLPRQASSGRSEAQLWGATDADLPETPASTGVSLGETAGLGTRVVDFPTGWWKLSAARERAATTDKLVPVVLPSGLQKNRC